MLASVFASPEYVAVTGCVPPPSKVVVQLAVPEATGCALQPTIPAPPSWKETVAPSMPPVTVAVSVNVSPNTAGFRFETRAVVVVASVVVEVGTKTGPPLTPLPMRPPLLFPQH